MGNPSRIVRTGLAALASALLISGSAVATAQTATAAPRATATATASVAPARVLAVGSVCYSALPSQAHTTLNLIDAGGPFPYSQDGAVFQNREGVLPARSSGYYHEYTVITPGSSDRGARRIVTGSKTDEDYYTADHYATFRLVNFGC